jgi:hypothetical protein
MKKVLLYILFAQIIFAQVTNLNGTYEVTYGFFGKMGEAKTSIKVDEDNNYIINIKAYATGFAKSVSGGLTETYISKGKVVDGKFRPNIFTKTTIKNDKKKYYTYIFDYDKKQIIKKYERYDKVYDNNIDLSDFSSYNNRTYHWKKSKENTILKFWTDEDILSLFFNIKDLIKTFPKGVKKHLVAIGAGESRDGQVEVIVPIGDEYNELKKSLEKKNNNTEIFKVIIHNKLFASKTGELYISLDEDGLCDKSMLKDVFMFGDVTGTLYKH